MTAMYVLPAPVAICTSDRSCRSSANERSTPATAVTWAGRSPSVGAGGSCRTFARHVGASGSALGVAHPAGQRRRLREADEPADPRRRVVAVGQVRLAAAGLQHEGQPALVRQGPPAVRLGQPGCVHRRLPLDAGQRRALGLDLDDADHAPVDVEQVVCAAVPGRQDDLADRHARAGEQVELPAVLHEPAGRAELRVDADAGSLLGLQPLAVHGDPANVHGAGDASGAGAGAGQPGAPMPTPKRSSHCPMTSPRGASPAARAQVGP